MKEESISVHARQVPCSSLFHTQAEDPESPRVAQLLDRVEKRETTIAELSKANRGLKVSQYSV